MDNRFYNNNDSMKQDERQHIDDSHRILTKTGRRPTMTTGSRKYRA